MRHPQRRRRHGLVVEPTAAHLTGVGIFEGREVVVERALLDLDQLARGYPATLVVGHQQVAVGPPVDAVGGADRSRSEEDFTLIARDLKARYSNYDAISAQFTDTSDLFDYNGVALIFNTVPRSGDGCGTLVIPLRSSAEPSAT